jgi:hypothetical protein
MFYTVGSSLRKLREQVETIRTLARLPEPQLFASSTVSGWTPSEHLNHLIRVASSVTGLAIAPDTPPLANGINGVGRLILAVGRIPRGRAAAPDRFRAERAVSSAILDAVAGLEQTVARISPDDIARRRVPTVKHPRFGGLTPPQALRFVAIHNDHHLRIIADILRA